METYIFKFSADDLRKIDSDVLGFLISSGHCCNELSAMMPYIAFEQSLDGANEVESALILVRRYTIDRIIISKIVEYRNLCLKFFGRRRGLSGPFISSLQLDYEATCGVLDIPKWAKILRNKASFHYDDKYALESLGNLDGNHSLRLIAGKIKGITLFEFSEEILSRPIFESAGAGDIGIGMNVVNRFILDSISSITSFNARSVIAAFKEYGLVTERDRMDLRESYCGVPGSDHVPISISSNFIANQNPVVGTVD